MKFITKVIEYYPLDFCDKSNKIIEDMNKDGWELICTTSPLGGFSDKIYFHFKKKE